jgi:MFS family permease
MSTEESHNARASARGPDPAPPPAPAAAAAAIAPRSGAAAALRVLRHREFAIFWVGQAVSMVGTWMQIFAQQWVVTTLSPSPMALGLVNFASSLPTLLLMPFGGVAADRTERRRILIYTQWAMLVLAVIMGVLVQTGRLRLWHVYLIAVPIGIATAYDLPAYQSFYPQLVPREDLPQAISLNQATFHGSRILGPALAGLVVRLFGTAGAFFANGASFLAVLASLALIRPRPAADRTNQVSPWQLMREGVRYVRARPQIEALLGLTAVNTLFIFPNLAVLMPLYVYRELHKGPGTLGTIMSVSGAGALLGAMLLLYVRPAQRLARITAASIVTVGTMSALAWTHQTWVAVAAVALQSLAIAQYMGLISIVVQEMVPDALRGRVMSLHTMMFMGVMPFSTLLVSGLAEWWGMRPELQGAAIGYAMAGAFLIWRLLRRNAATPGPGDGAAGAGEITSDGARAG